MTADWNIIIQVCTLILFITGWVTMYGNYRAGRAQGEALLGGLSKDMVDVKTELRASRQDIGRLGERMVRVETKLGLDEK